MIEFPFAARPSARYGTLFVPIAEIGVPTSIGLESLSFLIDSGADLTIISFDLGLRIGWKIEPDEESLPLAGMTGESDFVPRELDLYIGQYRIPCRAAWAQNRDVTNVLGRLDVFDFFNIEFRQLERRTLFRLARRKVRK